MPPPPPPPDLVTGGDSLQDAVMDFEQVLKKTMEDRSRGYSPPVRPNLNHIDSIDLLNNTANANIMSPSDKSSSPDKSPFPPSSPYLSTKYIQVQSANSSLMSSLLSSRSRSGSQSSLDSQSTVSTVSNFGVQVNLPEVMKKASDLRVLSAVSVFLLIRILLMSISEKWCATCLSTNG